MSKLAVGFFTIAIYAMALMTVPMVTPAEAAAESGKQHIKKNKRKSYSGGTACDPWSPDHSACSASEDFDRKNAGGGGGY